MLQVGRKTKLNGVRIDELDWFFIATELNEIGPANGSEKKINFVT